MKHFPNISGARTIILAWLALAADHAFCVTQVTSTTGSTIVAQESVGLWEFGRTYTTTRSLPAGFSTIASWKSLDAGDQFCLAVDGNGALYAWGSPGLGNSFSGDTIPMRVGTDSDWKSVSAGGGLSTAIRTNGSLWAWGAGIPGEMVSTQSSVPLQIGTSLDWKSTATGGLHRLAIRDDGSLWAWGYNSHGTLGDGTNINRSAPVRIGDFNVWASVAGGAYTSFALKTNGSLWAWGDVFGNGSSGSTGSNIPVQLGTETNWRAIYTSTNYRNFAFAIKQDGSLWSWGENTSGVLGLGDTTSRNSPVRVGTASDWSSVAPGDTHVIATKTDGTIWMWGHLASSSVPASLVPVDRSALFDPSPRMQVFGGNSSEIITSGTGSLPISTTILGEPKPNALTIRNDGLLPLSISAINLPYGFTRDPAPLEVPALASVNYQIRLGALAKGQYTGVAHVLSNHSPIPDFSFSVNGWVVSPQDDTDSDGLNDAAEVAMAPLGFIWNSPQPTLVETFTSNAKFAGLILTKDVFDVELKTRTPVINTATQSARLRFELLNPTTGSAIPTASGTPPGSPAAGIKLDFQIPENCGFVRIRGN